MRLQAASLLILAIGSSACSREESSSRPRRAAVQLPRAAVEDVATRFLLKIGSRPGLHVVGSLGAMFPIEASARVTLGESIDKLVETYGVVDGVECVGWRVPTNGGRLGTVVFLTYHGAGPALWQVTVIAGTDEWSIVNVKFSTEDVPGQLQEIGFLRHEPPTRPN